MGCGWSAAATASAAAVIVATASDEVEAYGYSVYCVRYCYVLPTLDVCFPV